MHENDFIKITAREWDDLTDVAQRNREDIVKLKIEIAIIKTKHAIMGSAFGFAGGVLVEVGAKLLGHH